MGDVSEYLANGKTIRSTVLCAYPSALHGFANVLGRSRKLYSYSKDNPTADLRALRRDSLVVASEFHRAGKRVMASRD